MRTILVLAMAAGLGLTAGASFAADTAQQGTMKTCAASWSAKSAGDKAKLKYKDYMSDCMKGPSKPEAAAAMKPAAAPGPAMAMKPSAPAMAMKGAPSKTAESGSAKCKDGTVVSYKHRSGTCSGHHGVATWM